MLCQREREDTTARDVECKHQAGRGRSHSASSSEMEMSLEEEEQGASRSSGWLQDGAIPLVVFFYSRALQ